MIRRSLCWVAAVTMLAGCGAQTTAPSEAVPALADSLTAVDRTLAAHRYPAARRHLADLVDTTEAARRDGKIKDDQADQVLAAAARLLAALPGGNRAQRQGSTPSAPPSGSESRSPHDDDANELEEEGKNLEEERHQDEGGGNGDSSENGPDDGHGN